MKLQRNADATDFVFFIDTDGKGCLEGPDITLWGEILGSYPNITFKVSGSNRRYSLTLTHYGTGTKMFDVLKIEEITD